MIVSLYVDVGCCIMCCYLEIVNLAKVDALLLCYVFKY